MAKIFPFKGITYNKDKVKKLEKVMAPPYDVISPEEQENLYNAHDYNIIKLTLGKDFPGDTPQSNKYVRAGVLLEGLLRHKILAKSDKPAIYVYEQTFRIKGKVYKRLGFLALLRMEEVARSKVFPHENIFPVPMLDRLELMRSTNTQLEPIFGMYLDEKDQVLKSLSKITSRKPFMRLKDKDKMEHKVWVLDKRPALMKLVKGMRDKWVFIADGHHRFEATQRYRDEMREKTQKYGEEEPFNHVMMYFTNIKRKGLIVLPIHRLIRIDNREFDPYLFTVQVQEYFEVTPYEFGRRTEEKTKKKLFKEMEKRNLAGKACFGMYLGGNTFYLLTLKDYRMIDRLLDENKPKTWKRLDVTVLHTLVIEKILGLNKGTDEAAAKIKYSHEEDEAISLVKDGKYQVALLLNPTRVEDVVAIASKYEKMPQKSTFFYPKLLSGLVMNKIDLSEKIEL
jgi:uncharacterized protein (DUF1015 family)